MGNADARKAVSRPDSRKGFALVPRARDESQGDGCKAAEPGIRSRAALAALRNQPRRRIAASSATWNADERPEGTGGAETTRVRAPGPASPQPWLKRLHGIIPALHAKRRLEPGRAGAGQGKKAGPRRTPDRGSTGRRPVVRAPAPPEAHPWPRKPCLRKPCLSRSPSLRTGASPTPPARRTRTAGDAVRAPRQSLPRANPHFPMT